MKNLIGKKWLDASSMETIDVINPATGELIDTVPSSEYEDVERAVNEAKIAQIEWAKKSIYERGEILLKFAELVKENDEKLAVLLCKETGKPIKEARAEIANVQISVRGFVEKARHSYGNVIPAGSELGQEKTIQLTVQEPLGVVACIIPFNFPIDLFGQKVPSALVMGNAVIVKPSSSNPLTIHMLGALLVEAGVTPGAICVISGHGETVGQALADNKDVALVSLTGSTSAGIQTMQTAAGHLAHVMLELGGNDAFIFLEDGNMDFAIEEVVWGRLYNTGQVCCASKRFLIHNSRKDEFIDRLLERIADIQMGDPLDEDTDIGCLISEGAARTIENQVNKTLDEGATLVAGGNRDGAFYDITILDNVTKDMEVAKDMEIFGPVISIIGFEDIEEAIEIANQSSFGLCGCVITENMKDAFYVASRLEVGGAVINGASFYRSFEMPFGGWKHSGIGNEGISSTLKEMSRTKTIVLKNIME